MSERLPARWMCVVDERIIEFVDEKTLASPGLLKREIRQQASENRIRERCEMLTEAGLIAPMVEGSELYEVTTEGQQYLKGEIDAEHQPRPSVGSLKG